jgi:hypothetical protein
MMTISAAEPDDAYPRRVAVLNDRWRVVECRHGIQWILQARHRSEMPPASRWRGRAYCRTKEALIRCGRLHAGRIDPGALAVLEALPDRIDRPDGDTFAPVDSDADAMEDTCST